MMKFLQNLGKSIMLPVAVLPVAAILVGIGNWIVGITHNPNVVATFLTTAGLAIVANMAILFAVGVSIGMAEKSDGTSALAGLVSWLVITTLLSPTSVQELLGRGWTKVEDVPGAGDDPIGVQAGWHVVDGVIESPDVSAAFNTGSFQNAFIGILCGIIGAYCYNKFKDVKLPDALSFFSGRRSVAIITAGISLIVALILLFIWPLLYAGLVNFGEWIVGIGAVGTGLYGFFNRLLIPFGLHHALNSVFWFDVAGINDLNNFLAGDQGDGIFGVTGQYMTGFFPIMMFGLPGAALAMYVTAKPVQKKMAYGILLSGAVASFFVGVTEPLEFSFMFLAPFLYVLHALFMGISMAVAQLLPVRMGFGFSGGFVDLVLNWTNPLAQNPWMIPVMGVFWFIVYFVVFRWVILRFKLKTPGREDDDDFVLDEAANDGDNPFVGTAAKFIDALGGADNITSLDNCATRLRMELADTSVIDEHALKRAGAAGTMKPGGKSVQVIYGTRVQFVKDAMEDLIAGRISAPVAAAAVAAAETEAPVAVADRPTTVTLRQPVAGTVIPLDEVPDKTFASGMMGPGLAIEPADGLVVAPAPATVVTVFPTGHAIGLRLDDGTELLIHVGLDTVKLKGEGFTPLVEPGDIVDAGQSILEVDLDTIRAAGYSTVTPVVVMNNKEATVTFG
ncbi:N-acetylglucosamine-specific PTS transporter subunit IIBC [Gordonia caeni]|uniref:N-acetylglucosamine-specific PTS transporter subunit IIBC n=1 Tax=Gordonia caeni TaxID=1007097 RepID=A0ABP7PGA4_9ACTN